MASLNRLSDNVHNGFLISLETTDIFKGAFLLCCGGDPIKSRVDNKGKRMATAMVMSGVRNFLAYDQVGSLLTVADGADNVVIMIDHDSFGNVIFDTDPGFFVCIQTS